MLLAAAHATNVAQPINAVFQFFFLIVSSNSVAGLRDAVFGNECD